MYPSHTLAGACCCTPKGVLQMKKSLCLVPVVMLFAVIGTPNARADSYTANFTTCSENVLPIPCAGFVAAPDVTFSDPTNIAITFVPGGLASAVFNFTLPAADSPTDTYRWSVISCCTDFTATPYSDYFNLADLTTNMSSTTVVSSSFNGSPLFTLDYIRGTLTFSPASTATPEPSTVVLMLLGVGLILLMRKRFAFGAERTAQTF